MTISQLLKIYSKRFKDAKIASPFLDAEILLAYVLKKTHEYILIHEEKKLSKLQVISYKIQANKHLQGWSIAYLVGKKEFYGLDFKVNKHTLIPRPETELMVEEALSYIAFWSLLNDPRGLTLVDVGTGSGCVIISLIKKLSIHSKFPPSLKLRRTNKIKNSKFYAIDISKKALKIAKQNAKQHGIDRKIKFLHGNLMEPLLKIKKSIKIQSRGFGTKLIICANLPYLTPNQVKNSPSIQKEPKKALVAGNDGLKYYRELFSQIKSINVLYNMCYVLCEIDPSQNQSIKKLAKKHFPDCKVSVKKDLSGKNRLVVIKII